MLRILLCSVALLSADVSQAMPICDRGPRVNCVVDGDTFWLGGVKYRLKGIDTPETRAKCRRGRVLAKRATNALQAALSRSGAHFTTYGMDRYKRVLVRVSFGGVDVGQSLIDQGLARHWPDGKKWWCP